MILPLRAIEPDSSIYWRGWGNEHDERMLRLLDLASLRPRWFVGYAYYKAVQALTLFW